MIALDSISDIYSHFTSRLSPEPSVDSCVDMYNLVQGQSKSITQIMILDVISSAIEGAIISDQKIINLLKYWNSTAPYAREAIAERIRELSGSEVPEPLVEHIYKCLSGSAAQRGRGRGEHSQFLYDILTRLEKDGQLELRCECCGYHFRPQDIGKKRRKTILSFGFELTDYMHPGRYEDITKPIKTQNNNSLTKLEVDHITPELRLGWSTSGNLQILCKFCNSGKLSFRRPFDAISYFACGQLSNFDAISPSPLVRNVIFVAILRAYQGVCFKCERNSRDIEQTVYQIEDDISFSPWSCVPLCYECYLSIRRSEDNLELSDYP